MVNYTVIADGDPGGDLQTAFAIMAAETITSTPIRRMNYLEVANELNFSASVELQAAVIAGVPEWVDSSLNGTGIDVNDPQSQTMLTSLVSSETAAGIIALGVVTVAKYTGLKIGHLDDARTKRLGGLI